MPRTGSTASTNEVLRVSRAPCSGGEYFVVQLGTDIVGTFMTSPTGYVANGCRKSVPTIEDAVHEVLWRRVRRTIAEGARLSAALTLPVSVDAVDPHAGSTGNPSTRVKE